MSSVGARLGIDNGPRELEAIVERERGEAYAAAELTHDRMVPASVGEDQTGVLLALYHRDAA